MKRSETRSSSRRISKSVMRVEQPAEFDDAEDDREEEERHDRKFGYGGSSFVLPVIQTFHVLIPLSARRINQHVIHGRARLHGQRH